MNRMQLMQKGRLCLSCMMRQITPNLTFQGLFWLFAAIESCRVHAVLLTHRNVCLAHLQEEQSC